MANQEIPKGDPSRFVTEADDLAIGIGPSDALRFIGMGLLERLKAKGLTEDEIYKLLPADGHAALTEPQLSGTAHLSFWDQAINAVEDRGEGVT